MRAIFTSKIVFFLLLTVLIQVVFSPNIGAGFVTDFTGLQWRIEHQPFINFVNSFGFPSLQPVLNFFLAIFYHLFRASPLGWHLVFTALHTINCILLYHFALQILNKLKLENTEYIAMAATLLFAFSPYQAEVLTWRVLFNFLFSTCMILLALLNTMRYLEEKQVKYLFVVIFCTILALFTFELAMMLPFFIVTLLLFWGLSSDNLLGFFKKNRLIFLFPLGLVIGYLGLNKLILGQWVGHYGEKVHLKIEVFFMLSNIGKYFVKHLFFVRYFPHAIKTDIFDEMDEKGIAMAIGLFLTILIVTNIVFFKKTNNRFKGISLLILMATIALLPICNMFFATLMYGENDRYGYLMSAFLSLAVAVGIFSISPKALRNGIFATYLGISLFFLVKTNLLWKASTEVCRALTSNYKWANAQNVYILNLPENYHGLYMFRDMSENDAALADHLQYMGRHALVATPHIIAQYNMDTPNDGVSVRREPDGKIIVEFNQWGNWWWRKGIGASDYETDAYKVTFKDHFYELVFKQKLPENTVILYQVGSEWKTL
jgi:hypothetical protein